MPPRAEMPFSQTQPGPNDPSGVPSEPSLTHDAERADGSAADLSTTEPERAGLDGADERHELAIPPPDDTTSAVPTLATDRPAEAAAAPNSASIVATPLADAPAVGNAGSGELLRSPIDAPTYAGEELQQALSRVTTALDRIHASAGASKEERSTAARAMYQRLCDVAQICSFVELDDPQLGLRMNATEALLARIAREPPLRDFVGRTAAGWLNYASRTSDGIALAGEVVRIEQMGPYFETHVRLLTRPEQVVRVVSRVSPPFDPHTPYDVGAQLLILGSIVANPLVTLPDYPASGPIVWRGLHFATSDPGHE